MLYCRSLVSHTLTTFVDLFSPSNTARLPIFRLELCLENEEIFFFPNLSDLEAAFMFAVEILTNALQNVGKIEVTNKKIFHCECAVVSYCVYSQKDSPQKIN